MSSEDLVAYLKERIDEEERIARTVFDGHRVNNPDHESHGELSWPLPTVRRRYQDCNWPGGVEFLEAFNPGRVLADIEAKRKIVDEYELAAEAVAAGDALRLDPHYEPDHAEAGRHARARAALSALGDVLGVLAQPYASRPDFNQEWTG